MKDYQSREEGGRMIQQINFNWRPELVTGMDGYGNQIVHSSANFDQYHVGGTYYKDEHSRKTCIEIYEHKAEGEGDKWYYDVKFDDGSINRIFNPNEIFIKEEKS